MRSHLESPKLPPRLTQFSDWDLYAKTNLIPASIIENLRLAASNTALPIRGLYAPFSGLAVALNLISAIIFCLTFQFS